MPTQFPAGLDDFPNPTSTTKMNADNGLGHTDQHANVNDAIEAIQRKIGIDGTEDTSSIDYKLRLIQDQNITFSCESPISTGMYVGARYKWRTSIKLLSANIVSAPPSSGSIVFELEVASVNTGKTITIQSGSDGTEEIDLQSIIINAGSYVRWKCVSSPKITDSASQVHISMNISFY